MPLLDVLKPRVDATIDALSGTEFRVDPIAGSLFSHLVSVLSSSYKRHGTIIENAIYECLRASDRYEVWQVDNFGIQQQALTTVAAAENDPDSLEDTHLPYVGDGNGNSKLQIDAVVFDRETNIVSAYEIKRGNGHIDAGKQRSIKRDALLAKILLKSHSEQRGFEPQATRTHVIFYYGMRSISVPIGLIGEELDEHFGMPIWEPVETVNAYYRRRLFEIISR